MPEISPRKSTPAPEFVSPNNGSTYWNDAIHPQLEASSLFSPDQKKAEEASNTTTVKLFKNDVTLLVGAGVDFYTSYFKFIIKRLINLLP